MKKNLMNSNKHYLPLVKLLPNTITLLSLCSGLSAIKFALAGSFERAVLFIVIAAILDLLDGRFARLLNAQSKMGAQLDSLCDFINFGFSPVFIMYLWGLKDVKLLGWGAVLIAAICTCIRLARFNVQEDSRGFDAIKSRFFSGVPSPAGGLLILSPLAFYFEGYTLNPVFICIYTIAVALLMASTLPTISTKKVKIKHSMVTPVMVAIGLTIVFIFLYGWFAMAVFSVLYLGSIPLSYFRYRALKAQKNGEVN